MLFCFFVFTFVFVFVFFKEKRTQRKEEDKRSDKIDWRRKADLPSGDDGEITKRKEKTDNRLKNKMADFFLFQKRQDGTCVHRKEVSLCACVNYYSFFFFNFSKFA